MNAIQQVIRKGADDVRAVSERGDTASRTAAGAAWVYFTHLVAATFALLIAPYLGIRANAAITDPDIWWHIRTGDWILQHHAFPRFAIFSQYADRRWVAYSWAFEVVISTLRHAWGLTALPGTLICIQILVSLALLMAVQRVGGNFWPCWVISVLAIYAIYGIPLRPMALTFLFFILELLVIFEVERGSDEKLLFWLGPLFVCWANVHIQFVYGLFVLGLYVFSRLAMTFAGQWWGFGSGSDSENEAARKFPVIPLAALLVAVAAACVGPYGVLPYKVAIDLAIHPGQNQGVMEMAAMSFRRPEDYLRLMLLVAAAFEVGWARRRDLFRPLLLLTTAVVSFHFSRDAWFVCIASAFVLAEVVRMGRPEAAEGRSRASARMGIEYGLATMAAVCLSFAFAIQQGMNTQGLIGAMDQIYPIRATEYIRDSNLKGPMYNTFNWGGFLIFNLPSQPVSVDPRVNIYGDELVARAQNTANGIDWQSDPVLARSSFVILERWAPLASALASDPRYKLAYSDHLATIFVRQPQ